MGNLLKVLYKKDADATADFDFVDFENCQPSEKELPVWTRVEAVLRYAHSILHELQQYRGAGNEIREAISHPDNDQHQTAVWQAVCPLVSQLKRYYEYSSALEGVVPPLLQELCHSELTSKEHLEQQQALFKQFAEILDFTLKFDDLKMSNPAIQNDFSYYRRSLSRMQMNNRVNTDDIEVSNELANRMSLFYAHATPMLKMLSETTSKSIAENKELPVENTTDCLCTMAKICRVMIENPEYRCKFHAEETVMFCLRVMVGVIILYDHVHPIGAFNKTSTIDIKSSIRVLRENAPQGKLDGLLNALRYTTKHLNDATTPKQVKQLLA